MNNTGLFVKFSSEETPTLFSIDNKQLKNIDDNLAYPGRPIIFNNGSSTIHLNWENIDYVRVVYGEVESNE